MNDATVQSETRDGVAVLALPAVPSLLAEPPCAALREAVARAHADPAVRALVLIGGGRAFGLGDGEAWTEGPARWAALGDVCTLIETGPKPVVAALNGPALGAGLALALAAHARLALPSARLGEAALSVGLVPGAGMTQRLPRLLSIAQVLRMIRAPQPLPAAASGLARVVEDALPDAARAEALHLAETGWTPTRALRGALADPAAMQREIAAARAAASDDPALLETLSCLDAACLLPFDGALDFEQAALEALAETDRAQVLGYLRRAERRLSAPPVPASVMAAPLVLGLLGADRASAGLAVVALGAGLDVILADPEAQAQRAAVEAMLTRMVRRGRLSEAARDARLTNLRATADPAPLAEATLVIETGPGTAAARRARWAWAAPHLSDKALAVPLWPGPPLEQGPGPILAIPGPPHVSRLAEVLVPEGAAPDASRLLALLRRMGRLALVERGAGVPAGALVERAQWRAALWLAVEGADPFALDRAQRAAGFAAGPFERMQQAGPETLAAALPAPPGPVAAALARLAQGGIRFYGDDGAPDAALAALLDSVREEAGARPREVAPDEAADRLHAAAANAAAALVGQGVVARPGWIDAAMVTGYGWPGARGGPLIAAQMAGLAGMRRRLAGYAADDAALWEPAPLWDAAITSGQGFLRM